ncbi:MAG: glycosyltransferase [Bacteroidia bacterium]|nr:glycosyltransferase [Bacteroidia bacterium]
MMLLWYISIILTAIYCTIIISFTIGWFRIKKFNALKPSGSTFVSVLIAVRNEENNVQNLLNCLLVQDYNHEKYEIIFIDDHSTDNTVALIGGELNHNQNISLLELSSDEQGKKKALAKGIKNAKGDLIITTDADCTMCNNWISTIVSYFEKFRPEMIIGPVVLNDGKHIFSKLQSLEFIGLMASGAGAAGILLPVLCNGANLAFTKEAFMRTQDAFQNKLISGDDIFFMLKLKKQCRNSIHFIKTKDAMVTTQAQNNLSSFIQQRARWVSKSPAYRDTDIILTAVSVFSINLILLSYFILSLFDIRIFTPFLFFFCLKNIVDLLLTVPFITFAGKNRLLLLFIPLQFVYIFYITFIAIYGNIASVKWKGRKVL